MILVKNNLEYAEEEEKPNCNKMVLSDKKRCLWDDYAHSCIEFYKK